MIVVSNTSPITNLAAIGQLSLLNTHYGTLYIPEAVREELLVGEQQGDHPVLIDHTPWLTIHPVSTSDVPTELLRDLDKGDAEAIALAHILNADLLLMDERIGRQIARQRGLRVVGILGTLLAAKERGMLLLARPIVDQLINDVGF